MRRRIGWLGHGLAALLLAAPGRGGAQANFQLLNSGFEKGDFSDWTISGGGIVSNAPGVAHSGQYAAVLPCDAAPPDILLSQTVATIPGQVYAFAFFLRQVDCVGGTSLLQVAFGNKVVLTLFDPRLPAGTVIPYTLYGFVVKATTSTTDIAFRATGGRGPERELDIDDVFVFVIPEPESVALLGGGLAAMAAGRRRRWG